MPAPLSDKKYIKGVLKANTVRDAEGRCWRLSGLTTEGELSGVVIDDLSAAGIEDSLACCEMCEWNEEDEAMPSSSSTSSILESSSSSSSIIDSSSSENTDYKYYGYYNYYGYPQGACPPECTDVTLAGLIAPPEDLALIQCLEQCQILYGAATCDPAGWVESKLGSFVCHCCYLESSSSSSTSSTSSLSSTSSISSTSSTSSLSSTSSTSSTSSISSTSSTSSLSSDSSDSSLSSSSSISSTSSTSLSSDSSLSSTSSSSPGYTEVYCDDIPGCTGEAAAILATTEGYVETICAGFESYKCDNQACEEAECPAAGYDTGDPCSVNPTIIHYLIGETWYSDCVCCCSCYDLSSSSSSSSDSSESSSSDSSTSSSSSSSSTCFFQDCQNTGRPYEDNLIIPNTICYGTGDELRTYACSNCPGLMKGCEWSGGYYWIMYGDECHLWCCCV